MNDVLPPAASGAAAQAPDPEAAQPVLPIPVLEVFGPTVQGEGMVIGQKTMFVRTAGCDYRCSWCDSAFTWDGSAKDQIMRLTPEEIWQRLVELGGSRFSHVTLSGGNPALLPQLGALVALLKEHGVTLAVETQGSRWQDWLADIDEVTLSPKPPSSGMDTNWETLDSIVDKLKNRPNPYAYSLKVVVFDDRDLDYAAKVQERYPDSSMFLQVGNPDVHRMDTKEHALFLLERYEKLVEAVMAKPELSRVRVLPQLHALIWGNKRGV
ncbi:7-carboxy-7-deazaguanine synthase QueE [Paenibacillus caui]|uniref:7-carboxy-7-deazaguanine synthase QueE n=1 Tax=Paenibacillus caui TaxID=2873927 RepID=UPI001CA9C415